MAARNHTSKAAQTTPREMPTLTPRQGLIALEYLLRQCTGAQTGMMLIDWQQWRQHYPVFAGTPLLADLMRETRDASRLDIAVNGKSALSRESLLAAEPPARSSLLESFVRGQVEAVMGIPSNTLDVQRPLSDMGLDSLMAIELKNRLESSLKVMLPMVQLLQGPSIRTLAALLLAQTTASSDLIGQGAAMVENGKTVDGWEILRI
jgi:acyl carrier protein